MYGRTKGNLSVRGRQSRFADTGNWLKGDKAMREPTPEEKKRLQEKIVEQRAAARSKTEEMKQLDARERFFENNWRWRIFHRLGATGVITIVFIFLAFVLVLGIRIKFTKDSPKLKPTSQLYLKSGAWLASDYKVLIELDKAIEEGTFNSAITRLISEEKAFKVANGTKCFYLKTAPNVSDIQVRVLEGQKKDSTGWVHRRFLVGLTQ